MEGEKIHVYVKASNYSYVWRLPTNDSSGTEGLRLDV